MIVMDIYREIKLLKKIIDKINGRFESRAKLDPSTIDDPIADKTIWEPLNNGKENFTVYNIKQIGMDRLEFRPSLVENALCLIFYILGAAGICVFVSLFFLIGMPEISFDSVMLYLTSFILGCFFLVIGRIFHHFSPKPMIFDKQSGHFWKGKTGSDEVIDIDSVKNMVKIDDIHACQLISEHCQDGRYSYHNYELNLVCNDTKRIHIISVSSCEDTNSRKEIRQAGQKLSNFLEKPLWDVT
jgi:hypothetical protein